MVKPKIQQVEPDTIESEFRLIPHTQLKPYSKQPRTYFSEKEIAELADSIDGEDQITPVLVTLVPSEERFTIIGGERRWRACCLLAERHDKEILMKAVVEPYKDEKWLFRSACMDNLHRQDMHPLDIASAYKRLRDLGETLDGISKLYGVSVAYVNNYLLLNDLDDRVKQFMHPDRSKSQRLGVSHAIEIAKIKDNELQFEIADEAMDARLTVSDVRHRLDQRADLAGHTVYSFRDGSKRRPSDDYKVMKSFLGRTETWLDRCGDKIEFADLYLYRDNSEQDLDSDLEQIKRIESKFTKLAKMLDNFDKA